LGSQKGFIFQYYKHIETKSELGEIYIKYSSVFKL